MELQHEKLEAVPGTSDFNPESFPVRHLHQTDGLVNVNGQIIPLKHCAVPINDRAVLYGDGVFEGIRLVKGRLLFHREHRERLYASAEKIGLTMPSREWHDQWLAAVIDEYQKKLGIQDAYVRSTASRGMSDLGINPRDIHQPAELRHLVTKIMLYPAELYANGIRLIVAASRKYPRECFDGSIKSLNYLNNIQAKREANAAGADDALMILPDGTVSEATVTNVFGVKGDLLFTPGAECNCLLGITRQAVLKLADDLGYKAQEGIYRVDDFLRADEVFLTGTGAGILPVAEIANQRIGWRTPGSVTLRLRNQYQARLASWSTTIQ